MKEPALLMVASLFMLCSVYPVMAQKRVVDGVEIKGNRSIQTETIKLSIQTKKDDIYSEEKVQRDFQAVLAQGYFDEFESSVRIEEGPRGGVIVIFYLKERPLIFDVLYDGLKSLQESDILQRFRERRVGVTKGSRYDPQAVIIAKQVLQELLGEKGKPNAQVEGKVEMISATAVTVLFTVNEGRRLRIKGIDFEGNTAFSDRRLRKAMRLVKESNLFTSITSKDIYNKPKLEEDLDRVRIFLNEKGYLRARLDEPVVKPAGEIRLYLPLIGPKSDGVNIQIPVNEGRLYHFGKVKVEGNTIFDDDRLLALIGLKTDAVASAKDIRDGVFQRLPKLYGNSGYIQAVPDLKTDFDEEAGTVDVTINIQEGKPFIIHRIEFTGNNITRDRVLRRELIISEEEIYNQEKIDLSILRLNQLGLFDEIKPADLQTLTDDQNGTVELTFKVKENGRQKIAFNGGSAGPGGSFIGISYSTNNLLGYGESLSLDLQLGNRQRSITASFTEPYLLGRPISTGISVFASKLKFFNDGLATGILTGGPVNSSFDSSLFTRSTIGLSLNLSAPLALLTERRYLNYSQFTRVGLNYSYSSSRVTDPDVNLDSDPRNDIVVSFRQPDIKTSTITPSLNYNTLNHPVDPTRGKSLSASLSLSGLGGDVKVIYPSMEVKYFAPVFKRDSRPQVLGMRFLAEHITSYGSSPETNSLAFIGGVPVFNRFFLGGEDSLRGFNVRSISPLAQVNQFITTNNVQAVDPLKNRLLPILKPGLRFRGVDRSVLNKFTFNNTPIGDPAFPAFTPVGADTKLLYNLEYRIPIAGPLSFALFADAGTVFNTATLNDQTLVSSPIFRGLNQDPNLTALGVESTVILNPRGRIATPEEISGARTPESNGNLLPKGFRLVSLQGNFISTSLVRLSNDIDGIGENFRASLGGEFRVQVPVVGLPVRLIFAYNPNARTTLDRSDQRQFFLERKTTFSFSIGRTF